MGRGGSEASSAVFGMCAFIWVVCSCFLLGFSFDTLEPNRMGLLYNENTCFLDTTTLYNAEEGDSGRWFTGLGQKFIEFPRNLQRIRFNAEEGSNGATITAKTFNGTSVQLDMAFQFGLTRTAADVSALYLTYGTDYARFFAKFSRQVVRDVVSDHLVFDLWEKRELMGAAMRTALDTRLRNHHAFVAGFQVLSLTIPTEIQSAIERTTVAFQAIGKARFEKDAEEVAALTRRLVAEKTSEVTVLQAEAYAAALVELETAKAKALNVTIQAETDVLIYNKNTFNFTSEEVLRYQWLDSLLANNAQKVTMAVQQPSATNLA